MPHIMIRPDVEAGIIVLRLCHLLNITLISFQFFFVFFFGIILSELCSDNLA